MAGNCTFAYNKGGTITAFKAWCTGYSYGYEMMAEESTSRRSRTLYPLRTYPSDFTVTLALKANTQQSNGKPVPGTSDYDKFGAFMAGYFNFMLELQNTTPVNTVSYQGLMLVALAGRGFARFGVPTTGVSFGDHVASLLYTPTINFVTAIDPRESSLVHISQTADPAQHDADWKYFYPWTEFASGTSDSNVYDIEQLLDYRPGSQGVANAPGDGAVSPFTQNSDGTINSPTPPAPAQTPDPLAPNGSTTTWSN